MDNAEWAADMSNNWNTVAPKALGYKKNDETSQKLRQFYLGSVDKPITNETVNGMRHVSTLLLFNQTHFFPLDF